MPEGRTPGASTGSPVVGDWRVARVGHALRGRVHATVMFCGPALGAATM